MGFANVSHGLRAMGYVDSDPLPAGPVALVTHSGSVFDDAAVSPRLRLHARRLLRPGTGHRSCLPSHALDVPDTKVTG
jgi:hypothetical protein